MGNLNLGQSVGHCFCHLDGNDEVIQWKYDYLLLLLLLLMMMVMIVLEYGESDWYIEQLHLEIKMNAVTIRFDLNGGDFDYRDGDDFDYRDGGDFDLDGYFLMMILALIIDCYARVVAMNDVGRELVG